MSDDLTRDPDFKAFAAEVHAHLIPMIMDSSATVSLLPTGEVDVKYAVELGLTIMLDKPLIVVAPKSKTIPGHLARAADVVVEIDWDDEESVASAQHRISEAADRLFEKEVSDGDQRHDDAGGDRHRAGD